MAAVDQGTYSLNAGEVSRLALARVDLKKLQVACEVQSNFLPRVLGPCEFRPGTAYFDHTEGNQAAKLIEFYFDEATKDLLVLTPGILEVFTTGAFITRPAVATAITNGLFTTDLSGWTAADEAGAVSSWNAQPAMQLLGTGTNYALRDQLVACANPGVEHALTISIGHGDVSLAVGRTGAGSTDYLSATLHEGWHSISFIPTGNFWIRLGANHSCPSLVRSIAIAGAGRMAVPTPWQAGDLSNVFHDQSQDVIFVACIGVQQQRIERRSQRSWSVTRYYVDNGPFRLPNLSDITLAPSGTTGVVAITASRAVFQTGHVNALFQLTHQGQFQSATLAGNDQYTNPVRVSGLKPQRDVGISVTGSFAATVTLQQSIAVVGSWNDVKTYTGPQSETLNDGLDNQVIFYRLGIKGGGYTSGAAAASMTYGGSVQVGICRITQVGDAQNAVADVLQDFGRTDPTTTWVEGAWSDYRGWPADLAFHDGRLFQAQGINLYGSESDAFASYDATVIGDAGPIARSITTGGNDGIRWLLSLQRLIAATAQQEVSIRSDAFDAPLTPTAFVARDCSTRGAARIRALKIDANGVFVGRDLQRIFKLVVEAQFADYRAHELTRLKQEMCAAGVVDCAVQRHPDTRAWFVLGDGSVAVLTYDEEDDVAAWTPFASQGAVERVAVLPGPVEDEVYFVVARTVGGSTVRFIERLALRVDCQAGTFNRTSDSHVVYSGAPTNAIAVSHLIGRQVVVWADGAARATYPSSMIVVDGAGLAHIPGPPVSNAVIGLPYTAKLKTAKLAYGAERGTALTMPKRVARVGLVAANLPWQGLKIGRSLDQLTSLPATYRGRPLGDGEVISDYDDVPGSFNGGWNPDSRVCLEISSPYSATIMGLVFDMDTNEPNAPAPAPRGNPG